jgi:hypothetical protein
MFESYLEYRRKGLSQRAAAETIAAQYGRRLPAEVADISAKMRRLEERDRPAVAAQSAEGA